MCSRALAVVWFAVACSACVEHSDLGGQAQATCLRDCNAPGDGPGLPDAGVKRPDSRYPSVPADQIPVFIETVEGTWWGFAEGTNRIVDSDDPIAEFEISFAQGPRANQGTFEVRCFDDRTCDPFGFGSAGGGMFTIADLSIDGLATGELAWTVSRGSEGPVEVVVPFDQMQVNEAGGPALTFDVGGLYSALHSEPVSKVVLAFGMRPDDAAAAANDTPVDAGAP